MEVFLIFTTGWAEPAGFAPGGSAAVTRLAVRQPSAQRKMFIIMLEK
jgi:hypothetical protein